MSKPKFKIMYGLDHHEREKAGKPYLPPKDHMVVMNGQGIFFLFSNEDYCQHITKLSNVIYKYDVVWK